MKTLLKLLGAIALFASIAAAQSGPFDQELCQGPTCLLLFQLEPPAIITQMFGPLNGPVLIGAMNSSNAATVRWDITVVYVNPANQQPVTTMLRVPNQHQLWSNFSLTIEKSWITSITIDEVSSTATFPAAAAQSRGAQ